ncbi:FMN-dependent NADH-azoreductase [Marinobacterium nitratireducens]|uniref:FMN dependent NADH:quinone oxidoreductase n=1 Tax=Marinobacterium nitratireducens TaxID=518897 RepID=A0A917Z5Q1_9GAMM|nr:NAD(P)H-dependent oxidoreductase [Marinobacterium nitratireducens]GGO75829.1 FMN-dependent NADH-azoreductase [Marinobacterium nitratireducens]
MTKALVIQSSALNEGSNTRYLTAKLIERLGRDEQLEVTSRDLAAEPLPHLDESLLGAFFTPDEQRTPEQRAAVATSDRLVAELQAHDVLVIAAPMYNFGVPSTLKAYLDHIARAGITFKYTEQGPVGLVEGKKAYIVAATGGVHAGTPRDFVAPYLRTFLGFIGIDNVEVIQAEGMSMSDQKETSIGLALEAIERI